MKKKPANLLADALDFDDDDLYANYNGHLSARQRARLRRGRTKSFAVFIVFLGLIGLFAYIAIATSTPIFVLGATTMYVFLPFWAVTRRLEIPVFGWVKASQILRDGLIGVVEGPVRLDIHKKKYKLQIEFERFVIKKTAFLAFKNSDPYRIYFVPQTRTVLSAEWLYDAARYDEESPAEQIEYDDEFPFDMKINHDGTKRTKNQ